MYSRLVCTHTHIDTQKHVRQAKYRGCVAEKEELSWVLKQDNDFYYSTVMKELKKKAKKVEQLMSLELKLGQNQYQNMFNVVQWLDEYADLYKRLVTHCLRRIDKNMYPSTLTHGDLRGENILFPQEHRKDFMLFDFQLMKELNGATDIAYLIVSSMTVKERRVHEENLLIQYLNEMRKRGASDLTWEELFVSYAYVSHLFFFSFINAYIYKHVKQKSVCHMSPCAS